MFEGILFLVILGLDTWSGRLKDLQYAWFARPIARLFTPARKEAVATVEVK